MLLLSHIRAILTTQLIKEIHIMEFTITQAELKAALSTVSPAVATKSPIAVLSNILITTETGNVRFTATNLEISLQAWATARIVEEGAITLPAKLLIDVVSGLPADEVTLTLDPRQQSVKLECGRFITNIKGIDADDFPAIPQINADSAMTLPAQAFREGAAQVAFAAATDQSRPVLAGVLLRRCGTILTLAAADGFRLARKTIELPMSEEAVAEVQGKPKGKPKGKAKAKAKAAVPEQYLIVPAESITALVKLLAGETGELAISVSENSNAAVFRAERGEMVSRLIDGKFPDFERIIPDSYETRAVIEANALLGATKMAALLAEQNKLSFGFTPNAVTLTTASENGDNAGEVEATVEGEALDIGLNVGYLRDAVAAVGSAQIAIEVRTPRAPAVVKAAGSDDYIHIIMPMSFR